MFPKLTVVIFILVVGVIRDSYEIDPSKPRTCYSCRGINCYRNTLNSTETCTDLLDVCVTIFDGYSVAAQGCFMNLPEEHRQKCHKGDDLECHKCQESLCNNQGRKDFKCVDCDSSKNSKCLNDLTSLPSVRCAVPKSSNSYCYFDTKDNKVVRGCSVEVSHQRDCYRSSTCFLCLPEDGEACNSNSLPGSANSSFAVSTFILIISSISKLVF